MDTDTMRELVEKMDDKSLKCPKCHKDFSKHKKNPRRSLMKHLVVHSNKRPFRCEWCNGTFKRRESRSLHKRRHCPQRITHHSTSTSASPDSDADGESDDEDEDTDEEEDDAEDMDIDEREDEDEDGDDSDRSNTH